MLAIESLEVSLEKESRLGESVFLRISVEGQPDSYRMPQADYLVVTGFFKLLRDLHVVNYVHQRGAEGLTFELEVGESRSVVRSHLQNMKEYHMLGPAWRLGLIEGGRFLPIKAPTDFGPLNREELADLVSAHLRMGSRPLRFSKYFLYAYLRPFSRRRGYGSCLMDRKDAKERVNFYQVLQAMDLLQRTFQSLDFSALSSAEEVFWPANPLENALNDRMQEGSYFHTILYTSLVLAALYERKLPFAELSAAIRSFAGPYRKKVLRPDSRLDPAIGETVYQILESGMEELIQLLEEPGLLDDLDRTSLLLFCRMPDRVMEKELGPTSLGQLQQLARFAIQDPGPGRDQLDFFFLQNGLVMDSVQDGLALLQLLALLKEED